MAIFSLLLLALNAVLRYAGWVRQLAPTPILDGIRNWAAIFLVAALPLYSWHAWMRRGAGHRRIDLRGTALLFGITLGALCSILLLRAALANACLGGRSADLLRCIQMLDLAGGLILPMISGFALIMLPDISLPVLRRAAKLVAVCCFLALAAVVFTARVTTVHAAPKGPANPIERQPHHGRNLA